MGIVQRHLEINYENCCDNTQTSFFEDNYDSCAIQFSVCENWDLIEPWLPKDLRRISFMLLLLSRQVDDITRLYCTRA